jgi:hypothetical protein
MTSPHPLDAAGRLRSPATMPGDPDCRPTRSQPGVERAPADFASPRSGSLATAQRQSLDRAPLIVRNARPRSAPR